MKNNMVFLVYLSVPALLFLAVVLISVYYRIKDEEPIVSQIFEIFQKTWESDGDEKTFAHEFQKLFDQVYQYEGFQANQNRGKYFLFKTLILIVIASAPFMALFLITKKEFVLGDNEWTNMYLYTIILVPIMLAYLLNKYIDVRQFRSMWIEHTKIKYHLEWRMMDFIKDYQMKKEGKTEAESMEVLRELKVAFINDMCEYWNTSTAEIAERIMPKEENLFQEIGNLFSGGK